jgi:hypothetical protein
VDSGVKSALSQMVDERRQSGKLTQDQADKLKQRINAEEFSGGFRGLLGGRHGPRMMGKRFFDMDQLASFFGESTADLTTELQQATAWRPSRKSTGRAGMI